MTRYGSAGSVQGDPRWITARYPAVCRCGAARDRGAATMHGSTPKCRMRSWPAAGNERRYRWNLLR